MANVPFITYNAAFNKRSGECKLSLWDDSFTREHCLLGAMTSGDGSIRRTTDCEVFELGGNG